MSKSLAETVDFARSVQTKQYEKRAQQVDTFVKSETAEQKLARSGKMQTAKALESLASLGGTFLDSKAKESEQRVKLIQEDLANITAAEIEEQRNGNSPYTSETFASLPLRFQTRVRSAVGYERGQRLIAEAEASMDSFTLQDDVARLNHVESYMQELELTSGMDAHELVGYNKGWQEGVDRINIAASKAKTAEGEKKVERDFKGVVSSIVTKEHEHFLTLEENGDLDTATDAYKIELRNNAAGRTYESIEAKFQTYADEAGIEVPKEIKKQWVRESILEAAKATNNPYLLAPENLPKEYQDDATRYFFAGARVAIKAKFQSDQRSAVAASNAQRVADRNQAAEDVFNGTVNRENTSNPTLAQKQALDDWEERGKLTGATSKQNSNKFEQQVVASIQKGSPVLIDSNGNEVKDRNGNNISLDREALDSYLLYNPLFLDNEQGTLSSNLGSLLVGIDTAAYFPQTQVSTFVRNNAPLRVPAGEVEGHILTSEMALQMEFEERYEAAQEVKGWNNPLSYQERKTLIRKFILDMNAGTVGIKTDTNNTDVSLDGETVTTEETTTEQPNQIPKVVKEPTQSQLDWFESNKNDPKAVENWEKAGFEIPEISDEELIQNLEKEVEKDNAPKQTPAEVLVNLPEKKLIEALVQSPSLSFEQIDGLTPEEMLEAYPEEIEKVIKQLQANDSFRDLLGSLFSPDSTFLTDLDLNSGTSEPKGLNKAQQEYFDRTGKLPSGASVK